MGGKKLYALVPHLAPRTAPLTVSIHPSIHPTSDGWAGCSARRDGWIDLVQLLSCDRALRSHRNVGSAIDVRGDHTVHQWAVTMLSQASISSTPSHDAHDLVITPGCTCHPNGRAAALAMYASKPGPSTSCTWLVLTDVGWRRVRPSRDFTSSNGRWSMPHDVVIAGAVSSASPWTAFVLARAVVQQQRRRAPRYRRRRHGASPPDDTRRGRGRRRVRGARARVRVRAAQPTLQRHHGRDGRSPRAAEPCRSPCTVKSGSVTCTSS